MTLVFNIIAVTISENVVFRGSAALVKLGLGLNWASTKLFHKEVGVANPQYGKWLSWPLRGGRVHGPPGGLGLSRGGQRGRGGSGRGQASPHEALRYLGGRPDPAQLHP